MVESVLLWLGVISLVECGLWLVPFWRFRRWLVWPVMIATAAATLLLLWSLLSVWTVLVAILTCYRLLNLSRIVVNRMQARYLYRATQLTSLWLIGLQAGVISMALYGRDQGFDAMTWWYLLGVAQTIATFIVLVVTVRNLRAVRSTMAAENIPDKHLPTLTIAVPARNETSELENCLLSLTASDYPKLEILVLDDCSQNKRTPEIIKSFAQSGVRFMAGSPPPEHWLAKNHAYAQLSKEANGEIILFCGVDTSFTPTALRELVCFLEAEQLDMMSLLPVNKGASGLFAKLVQPARYAWELSLPRKLIQRPPVLSTCWLIRTDTIKKLGGFNAVRRKPVPESFFARQLFRQGRYAFFADSAITSQKSLDGQRATAVRTRYPQLHRRPELVVLMSLALFAAFAWPLFMLGAALAALNWPLIVTSSLSLLLALTSFGLLVGLTFRKYSLVGFLLAPIAALYDIGLLNYSMWLYEFREVIWKGRNICLPVMIDPTPSSDSAQK